MTTAEGSAPASAARPKQRYKLHWHVVLTHFPVSAFAGAFVFMALHLLTEDPCMSRASYVTLVASAAVLVPVTLTGWQTWKKAYNGSQIRVFRIKIAISAAMIPLAAGLAVYYTVYPFERLDPGHGLPHLIYFAGLTLLMLGAMAEGYYGGQLHHR